MSFFSIVLFGSTFLIVFFSLHLFTYSKGNVLLNRLLSQVLLSRGFIYLITVLLSAKSFPHYELIVKLMFVFLCFTPPVFYLYVRAFLSNQTRLRRSDYLHFLPSLLLFLFFVLSTFFVPSIDFTSKDFRLFSGFGLLNFTRGLYFVFYMGISWKVLWPRLTNSNLELNGIAKKWLLTFCSLTTMLLLASFVVPISVHFFSDNAESDVQNDIMVLIASMLTMYFSIYIIRQPYILYGDLASQLGPDGNIDPAKDFKFNELTADLPPKKQPAVSISEEQVLLYQSAFLHHMQTAKPYLDADFNISMLAEQLNMPVHHCSFLLNHTLDLNFRECVNQYRVKYFIEEYQLDYRDYTFETMSRASGFKNKKTFNTAFSKFTGMSPSEYFLSKSNP